MLKALYYAADEYYLEPDCDLPFMDFEDPEMPDDDDEE